MFSSNYTKQQFISKEFERFGIGWARDLKSKFWYLKALIWGIGDISLENFQNADRIQTYSQQQKDASAFRKFCIGYPLSVWDTCESFS